MEGSGEGGGMKELGDEEDSHGAKLIRLGPKDGDQRVTGRF
jgi:hypothetical protein